MKMRLLLCALVFSIATYAYANSGTITFTGQIVPAPADGQFTKVVPQTTTATDGASTPQYAVVSAVTGRTLATFSTASDAATFASQVSPNAASQP